MRKRRASRRRRTRRKQRGGTDSAKLPPESIRDHIPHVIFVNLDKRTNRAAEVQAELAVFPKESVHRLSAVENAGNPRLGCTKSHLAALRMAQEKGWSRVLIVEDDFVWANLPASYKAFEALVKKPFDVIMLGAGNASFEKGTHRIKYGVTTVAYLVNGPYIKKIIEKLEKAVADFEAHPSSELPRVTVDTLYSQMQVTDQWFLVHPYLVKQRPGFSNVQKMSIDYTPQYNMAQAV